MMMQLREATVGALLEARRIEAPVAANDS